MPEPNRISGGRTLDINATLIVQMITFALFIWFTMKFVWPPIMKALEDRQNKIADGLAAAERGQRELELSQHRVTEELKDAKSQASEIVDKANRRASQIIEEAKATAHEEGVRLAKVAREQIEQEVNQVKDALRKRVAVLAVAGAEKILERQVDEAANSELLDNLIQEL